MNSTDSNFKNCNETLSVITHPIVPFLQIFQTFLCLIAGLTNSILSILLWRSQFLHYNVRFLLGNLALTSLIYAGTMAGKCLYNTILIFTNPCDLHITNRLCKISEIAVVGPLLTNGYCLTVIGLERIYATIHYQTYETKINRFLSVFLSGLAWSSGFAIMITTTLKASEQPIAYCLNSLATTKMGAIIYIGVTCGQEVLGICIFIINLLINKRQLRMVTINQAQHTLTARFQLTVNIEMCQMMLPTAIAHATAWIPAEGAIGILVSDSTLEFVYKVIGVMICQICLSLFCVVYPILFIYKHPRLQNELRKLIPTFNRFLIKRQEKSNLKEQQGVRHNTDNRVAPRAAGPSGNHFDIVNAMWEKPKPKPKTKKIEVQRVSIIKSATVSVQVK